MGLWSLSSYLAKRASPGSSLRAVGLCRRTLVSHSFCVVSKSKLLNVHYQVPCPDLCISKALSDLVLLGHRDYSARGASLSR